jgi:TPR repeat protein
VPGIPLDGELTVDAIANAPLPLPWDGKGSYMVALYSFYKNSHGCVLDLQAAKLDLPENRAKCAGIRYQQRFLAIDPQNRTVTEASYMFMGANGLAHLLSAWPRTTYPLDGPLVNAHVTMLRKAVARLQPLADRHAAANANTHSDYQKMWEQSRQIARESVTPPSQGGSIVQETPEMRARMEQLEPHLQERAVRDQVDGQRWTCRASGSTKQECETQFPYPSTLPAAPPNGRIEMDNLAQAASSQETASIEQKALLDQACTGGNSEACDHLGSIYADGLGGGQDYLRAAALFVRACDEGDTNGCIDLGVLTRDGHGVTRDYSHAAALFTKSCDAGNVNGCERLGSMYDDGKGVSQDYTRAVSLYSKACGQGLADACSNLGNMYVQGRGVERDYPKSATLFTKACDAGSADGCSNLGVIYQNGWGVPQDQRQAFALYLKACDAGSALGCNGIATMYQDGKGVVQDYPKAFAAYSKSCDKGYAVGCSNLGVLYRNGYGIRLDLEKAKQLFGKGCSMGDQWGCEQAQQLP